MNNETATRYVQVWRRMIICKSSFLAMALLMVSPLSTAQNRVVVIPLMGDEPTKTELVFSRVSTQCESGETVFLEGLHDGVAPGDTTRFYLDDSDRANPFIAAVSGGPTLPDATSRIDIFVRGIGSFLDTEIAVGNSGGFVSLVNDLNDCSSPTESTPFSSAELESASQAIVSITGNIWLITSNVTVRRGVITLGPTLFRLSQPD